MPDVQTDAPPSLRSHDPRRLCGRRRGLRRWRARLGRERSDRRRGVARFASTSAGATTGRFSFEMSVALPGADEPLGVTEGARRRSRPTSTLARYLGGVVGGLAVPDASGLPDFDDPAGWNIDRPRRRRRLPSVSRTRRRPCGDGDPPARPDRARRRTRSRRWAPSGSEASRRPTTEAETSQQPGAEVVDSSPAAPTPPVSGTCSMVRPRLDPRLGRRHVAHQPTRSRAGRRIGRGRAALLPRLGRPRRPRPAGRRIASAWARR